MMKRLGLSRTPIGSVQRGVIGPCLAITRVLGAAGLGAALLSGHSALAADPLPILASNVVLGSPATVQTYSVDLATLPTRPVLVVEVFPPPSRGDMQLQIEVTNVQAPFALLNLCPGIEGSIFSTSGPGVASLSIDLFECGPLPVYWDTATLDVQVRATHFGANPPPAAVSVAIRAETRPATGTLTQQVDTSLAPRFVVLPASKDTVLYEELPGLSNGAGTSLWAGDRTDFVFQPPIRRHALMAFDLSSRIPLGSAVSHAELWLDVKSVLFGGGLLSIHRLAASPSGTWDEGDAFAFDDQFFGAASSLPAADWGFRSWPTRPWSTPGGDLVGAPLLTEVVNEPVVLIMSSPALTTAVQDMVSTGLDEDGFALVGPNSELFTVALEIASREDSTTTTPPALIVDYTPSEILETGTIETNAVTFIEEGQNFRWIYDLDHDDIVQTNRDGICEVVDTSNEFQLPYTYRYEGDPFTGVDCCTWRIDSQTGVVGTGQALFFHNLDAGNPTNMPPDTDQDGIRDLCDNCPSTANGPLRGTCLIGAIGAPCRSNPECGSGGKCNLSQEDSDGNTIGNVCIPEPRGAAGLAAGLLLMGVLRRQEIRR